MYTCIYKNITIGDMWNKIPRHLSFIYICALLSTLYLKFKLFKQYRNRMNNYER